ncbi:MAG TPA: pyridoxal 5'-phosphate synthase glutaminase subunit PdxT [Actinomycetota bacterium]|nr:pyridoxal 5'-phosphate synthase glutaminase subunit PdxT [Actinomycetota bacterium]
MKVGVLALQGDVREHARALETVGATPVHVKHADQFESVDALIVPGGESTTIGKLLDRFGLLDALVERAREGMPLYGTCAGAILMATEVIGREDAPHRFSVLDISVKRNAYGRQIESFESDLAVEGFNEDFRAVFIRAPIIERVGDDVEVLATWDGRPVLVRQGRLLASTFHPEMTDDPRIHELFVGMI